ncbi:hypothetical protein A0H81_04726 [Grifola frondosa]|uniref:Uncharacterized protein n=1 Tax=Grifola frondosa TaxID=5627 RepID=A0A1C7MF78_GRIFR|nr:hypothetical protein A0H81_04726 [Grifola frondosa]
MSSGGSRDVTTECPFLHCLILITRYFRYDVWKGFDHPPDAHSFPIHNSDGSTIQEQAGFSLTELAKPLGQLLDAGYDVTTASRPMSTSPTLGTGGPKNKENDNLVKMEVENNLKSARPFGSITDAELESFSGIFVPGGHAPISALGHNSSWGAFYSTSTTNTSQPLTSWSDAEERLVEKMKGGEVLPRVESTRDAEGAGANPIAVNALGTQFIEMLLIQRSLKICRLIECSARQGTVYMIDRDSWSSPSLTTPIMAANIQDAIMLLGDSLTQHGWNPSMNGFAAQLAHAYSRKMDIVNRGFSGYNSEWIIPAFEQVMLHSLPPFPGRDDNRYGPQPSASRLSMSNGTSQGPPFDDLARCKRRCAASESPACAPASIQGQPP